MEREITTAHSYFRDRVVVFLAFMTSERCREVCRRHAMSEELAAALARLWFDEISDGGHRIRLQLQVSL